VSSFRRVPRSATIPKKEFGMSLQSHIAELTRRHQAIEREIASCKASPGTEPLKLAELKRKKLQLKDEMTKLRH
jgi:hypothetical protein